MNKMFMVNLRTNDENIKAVSHSLKDVLDFILDFDVDVAFIFYGYDLIYVLEADLEHDPNNLIFNTIEKEDGKKYNYNEMFTDYQYANVVYLMDE